MQRLLFFGAAIIKAQISGVNNEKMKPHLKYAWQFCLTRGTAFHPLMPREMPVRDRSCLQTASRRSNVVNAQSLQFVMCRNVNVRIIH